MNVSPALAVVFDFVNEVYKNKEQLSAESWKETVEFFKEIDSIFGILKYEKAEIPLEVIKLAEERLLARKNKDWKKSDELREKISKLGYVVGDTKEGYEVRKS